MTFYRKILLTTDFPDYSKVAVPHAVAMVRQFDTELLVLHVLEPLLTPVDFAWGPMALSEDWEEQRTGHSQKFLNEWVNNELPADISATPILAHGTPIREILHTIREQNIACWTKSEAWTRPGSKAGLTTSSWPPIKKLALLVYSSWWPTWPIDTLV